MDKLNKMWENHLEILVDSFPSLHHLQQVDRDSLELLDFHMVGCLETFILDPSDLTAEDIVLLYKSKRSLASIFKKLDGVIDSKGYFEQLLKVSKEVLRRVNVKEACALISLRQCEEIGDF